MECGGKAQRRPRLGSVIDAENPDHREASQSAGDAAALPAHSTRNRLLTSALHIQGIDAIHPPRQAAWIA